MKTVRESCIPRPDVLKGDLQDAIFAADFGHVVDGRAPKVYQDPKEFIRNTYPTKKLKTFVGTVFDQLSDPKEPGANLSINTGFGGGKTHTLIVLWHLAKNISIKSLGTELLPAAGRPNKVVVAAVDGEKFGATVCGNHGELQTHSLWGELAFQLRGKSGYNKVKTVDHPETAPDEDVIRAFLPANGPVLILLDEMVSYLAKLTKLGRKSLGEFLRLLQAEIGARPQSVLVITAPGGQGAYKEEVAELGDILDRREVGDDIIADEGAQIIIRRLFDKVDEKAADGVSSEYYTFYKRVSEEHSELLSSDVATRNYAERIVQCYPFHPRLMDTVENRLGALQSFQKGRGTLRLFARILRALWDSELDVPIITAGDLDWTSSSIQADLLQRLEREEFKAAVDADVVDHAGKLDSDYDTRIHSRVASALLLESLPYPQLHGDMDKRDLTLATLSPSDVGHEAGEAMDRLLGVCWHTYKVEGGLKYQFQFEPNANKVIEERAQGILEEDSKQAVRTLAQKYFNGRIFSLVAYPQNPRSVADDDKLKLVLCDAEQLAQKVCDFEDDTERPRAFRNAIFGIAPTPTAFAVAVQDMRKLLAAEEVVKEQKRKSPLREQVEELLPFLRKRAGISATRAFNRVVFQGRKPRVLEEKYLVSEDSALESVKGQSMLKEFLDDRKLVYQSDDVLDVDLLCGQILQGATPSSEHDGAYAARSVHERALGNDKLRLMIDASPVRRAVLKAVTSGKLVVRLPNGDAYHENGFVTGEAGSRNRIEDKPLATLDLKDTVLLAPPSAPSVVDWLKVDDTVEPDNLTIHDAADKKITNSKEVEKAINNGKLDSVTEKGAQLVVNNDRFKEWQAPTVADSTVYTLEEAIAHAAKRPLRVLTLVSTNPVVANTLISLAQPFGAQSLDLSVKTHGELKDGGTVSFMASHLKHNHVLKPLDLAAKLVRAMGDAATVEARLELNFGDSGIIDAAAKFKQAPDDAYEDVNVIAEFGAEE